MILVKRIVKNTAILLLSNVLGRIFLLILSISIARYLGPVQFGKYSFAYAFALFFIIFLNFGLNELAVREVARNKNKVEKYMGNLFYIKILLSFFTFFLIFVFINLLNYPADTRTAVYILGIYVITSSFSNIFSAMFGAFEKMEYAALTNVSEKFILVSFSLVVLILGHGLLGVVSIFLFAGIIRFLMSLFIFTKKFSKLRPEIDLDFWKFLIKNSFYFWLTTVFVVIYYKIDILMISLISGDSAVGFYSAAYNLVRNLSFIQGALVSAMYPVMSIFYKTSQESLKDSYNQTIKYMSIISLPIVVGTFLLSENIITLLYGKEYTPAVPVLKILIWVFFFSSISQILGVVLKSADRQIAVAKLTGICALINILLNILLIPRYGFIGASVATLATEIILFALIFQFVSRALFQLNLLRLVTKPVISSLAMGMFILLFYEINIVLLILSSGIFYIVFLCLIKGFSKKDREIIKNLISFENR